MSTSVEEYLKYAQMGISTIPCKKFFDEKDQKYSGKRPGVSEWEKYSFALPTEEEIMGWQRLKSIWGMAIVTGPASNICCVDIDTEDPELQERIIKQLPYTPIVVLGKPGRAGKFLYRIAEYKEEIPENYGLTKFKVKEPGKKSSAVDFFFSKSYICIPKSFHSANADESDTIWYTWKGEELNSTILDNLPVLDPVVVERVRMAVEGLTNKTIHEMLPGGHLETEEESCRWQQVVNLASNLIRELTPFEVAIERLLSFDHQHFPKHSYFLDRSKGCKTANRRVNCYKFYADLLSSTNVRKTEMEMEIPESPKFAEIYDTQDWGDIMPLTRRLNAGVFNPDWMPPLVKDVVMRSSQATAVDPAMVFFYMLGTFSACIGNKVVIQPYHMNHEYTETCNLYVGLVAKSGDRKSEITKIAKKALLRVQKEEQEKMKATRKAAQIHNENIEIRIDKIKSDIRKEVQEAGPKSLLAAALHKEIAELETAKITTRSISLYEQENTPEAYYGIVENNPHGIFFDFNEWGTMYDYLSSTEGTRLRRFLLDGWDGQNQFTYKTKHQGENLIERLNLSVGFCSQEDVISHVFWRMFNVKRDNDGLMQRFLLILSDGKYRPTTDTALTIPDELVDMFRNAYAIKYQPDRVMLNLQAYDFWLDFLETNRKARMELRNPTLESFYSKFDGLIIRIAANLTIMKANGHRPQDITLDEIKTAHEIVLYLQQNVHAIKALGEWSVVLEVAKMLEISAIQDMTSLKDVYRQNTHLFTSAEQVKERLWPLHEHNYIRIINGPKGWIIRVNPKLMRKEQQPA